MKHIYNESANWTDDYDVAFDTNDWWNNPKTVPVIGLESVVTHARLRYTREYLPPCICSLIKPADMPNWFHFPPRSSVML